MKSKPEDHPFSNLSNSDPLHKRHPNTYAIRGPSSVKKRLPFSCEDRKNVGASFKQINFTLLEGEDVEPTQADFPKRKYSNGLKNFQDLKLRKFRRSSLLKDVEVCDDVIRSVYSGEDKENVPIKKARMMPVSNSVIEIMEDPKPPHMIGFTNQGNTCYLNAILQTLFGLSPFASELLKINETFSIADSCLLTKSLIDVIKCRAESRLDELALSLRTFKTKFEQIDSHFAGCSMHDANEFLIKLLDAIRSELASLLADNHWMLIENGLVKEVNSKSYNELNPVETNFCFSLVQSLICTKCGNSRSKDEEYTSLNICVPDDVTLLHSPSIQDALDYYFKPEMMELSCEICKNNEFRSSTMFKKLPRVLILQLKRYKYFEECQKNNSAVALGTILSVEDHLALNSREPLPWHLPSREISSKVPSNVNCDILSHLDIGAREFGQYKLFSVVCHYGTNITAGHYVADVFNFSNQSWYHYNDEEVNAVNEVDVLDADRQENGYVFFYVYSKLLGPFGKSISDSTSQF